MFLRDLKIFPKNLRAKKFLGRFPGHPLILNKNFNAIFISYGLQKCKKPAGGLLNQDRDKGDISRGVKDF